MNHEKNNQTFKKDIDASIKTNTENSNDTENIVDDSLFEVLDKETYNAIDFREVVMFSGSIEDYLDSLLIASQEEEEEQMNPIVKETLEILDNLGYRYNGIKVRFPDFYDYSAVEVLSPQTGSELLREDMSSYPKQSHCSYSVTNQDSFEAASKFEYPMVMNFANAYAPGGGFVGGSIAQEECLCHESILYNVLSSNNLKPFYEYNLDHLNGGSYEDRAIYTPDVLFVDNNNLPKFKADVLTCASPNYGYYIAQRVSKEKNYKALESRINFVKNILVDNNVDIAILGAYGCGVFHQDPFVVAKLFSEAFSKDTGSIKKVYYAIPGGHNYFAFERTIRCY